MFLGLARDGGFGPMEPPPMSLHTKWIFLLGSILVLGFVIHFLISASKLAYRFISKGDISIKLLDSNIYLSASFLLLLIGLLNLSIDCTHLLAYSSKYGLPAMEALTGDLSRSFKMTSIFISYSIGLNVFNFIYRMLLAIVTHKQRYL